MLDTATGEPVRVLKLPLKQLEPVRKLLTDHGIRFWVGHHAVSVNGGPAIVWINIRKGSDSRQIQALLDQAA
jgi:hypothetical protein